MLPGISSTAAAHFREVAVAAELDIEEDRTSAVLRRGLLVAASPVVSRPVPGGGQDIGLIHVASTDGWGLITEDEAEVRPGNYVLHAGADGLCALRPVDGGDLIPLSPPAARDNPIPPDYCATGKQIELHLGPCEICLFVVCPGLWIVMVGCLRIPGCNPKTGKWEK